jgi:putative ABC transport system permease protein
MNNKNQYLHKSVIYANIVIESMIMALQAIKLNKLRAILTLFGLSIGIFSIVGVFSAVDALEYGIRENVASLGSDVIYIQKWPWSFDSDYKWWEYMKRPVPKYSEYEILSRKVQSADAIAFVVSTVRAAKYKDKVYDQTAVVGNTYNYQNIRSFEIVEGRYFSPNEDKSGKNICLLGANIKNYLFGNQSPIDQFIKINGRKIRVIGVLKKEGANMVGGSMDDLVVVPLSYARNIFDIRSDNLNPFMIAKVKKDVPLEQLKEEIRSILRKLHGLKPNQNDDFSINQSSMIISGINQIFKIINLAGWVIGGFSLLVGGFGIANIMFVSVKERTNQIGIQKALGAKNIFILLEFLFEGIILAIAGGIVGIILVFLLIQVAGAVFNFHILFTLKNILFGLFVSSITGVVAAIWPAYSAARLNPVEAINTTF